MTGAVIQSLWSIVRESWGILSESGPYILFGILVAGLLEAFVKREKIAKYLGAANIKSVIISALFGIPLPLCSCGVIPAAVYLRKSGASRGATLSFLISTPESGVTSMAITYVLIDPLMTVFRPLAAFVTALVAGVGENFLGGREEGTPDKGECPFCGGEENASGKPHDHTLSFRLFSGLKYAFTDLLEDIGPWLLLGIVIAGGIAYFIPRGFITDYLGSEFVSLLVMLAIGIPMYICASASTPIAAVLIAKGMSPGAALVFLLAGPATNAATVTMVAKFLGKRSVVIYLVSISVCAVLLGLLLNVIYLGLGIDVQATIGKARGLLPSWLNVSSAVLLLVLIAAGMMGKMRKRSVRKE